MSNSSAQPLLQKMDAHEVKLKDLAGRIRQISSDVRGAHQSIKVEPTNDDAQDTQRAEADREAHAKSEEIETPVLDLDSVKKRFRHFHKMKKGFRSLCSISVYCAVILVEFWCANHTQSVNNSFVRLSGALLSDLEKIEKATTSHEMWTSIKDNIIEKTIFGQNQSINNAETQVNLTYVFAHSSYLVGDLAITFSFGHYEDSGSDVGYRSLRPFQQHNYHENQTTPRHLRLDGENILVKPNKELPHTLPPMLEQFGFKFLDGYTVAIPSTADKHAIKTLLESYDTFVENEPVFDVSLDFIVIDPTVNPADWKPAAVTTLGLVHSEYTVSPQWTSSRGTKIQGAQNSEAQGSAKLKILPRDLYNFEQHRHWQIAHIFFQLLILAVGIRHFLMPHIQLACGRKRMEKHVDDYFKARSPDPSSGESYRSEDCQSSGTQYSPAEDDICTFEKKLLEDLPISSHVPHDRSGLPKGTFSVVALPILIALYVVIILAITWSRAARHSLVRPEKLCDNPSNAKVVIHHFENDVWPAWTDVVAYSALRDFNTYVQICIILLFARRIYDHAEFHPQLAKMGRAFAVSHRSFTTVFISYVFLSFVIAACSSIFWGAEVAAVSGFGSATLLVVQSEFKLTSLTGNVPWLLNLAFCIMCDLLIFKILTGMILDAYKKLSSRKTIEPETSFIADLFAWLREELTWFLFRNRRESGYVHPLQTAIAAHFHRQINSRKADKIASNGKESSGQSLFDEALAAVKRCLDHEFIKEEDEIKKALNRVCILAKAGEVILLQLIEQKQHKDLHVEEYSQATSARQEAVIAKLERVRTDFQDLLERCQRCDGDPLETELDSSSSFGDLIKYASKQDKDICEIKDDTLARISLKLAIIQKARGNIFKVCEDKHVRFVLDYFGVKRSVAVQKYVTERVELENKKKADKEKAAKDALSKEDIKDLRMKAAKYLKAGSCFEDSYVKSMTEKGKKHFHIFDVNCVGMMDVRFTGYWVKSMESDGLRQDLTEDDFLQYMERDPYFWEWKELRKLLEDPKNHNYTSANSEWISSPKILKDEILRFSTKKGHKALEGLET